MSDRICVMNQGAIEQIGAPDELYYRPSTRFVATFFGDNNLLPGSKATGGAVATPFGTLACADPRSGSSPKRRRSRSRCARRRSASSRRTLDRAPRPARPA